jgi:formylglycine-generating enzyme required for sulfatase activity
MKRNPLLILPGLLTLGLALCWALGPPPALALPPEPTPGQAPAPAPGQLWVEPTTGMKFAWIPAGCFIMGSNSTEAPADVKPAHRVCLDGFWMSRGVVTNQQRRTFMTDSDVDNPDGQSPEDDLDPDAEFDWPYARAFARWLSLKNGARFDLPTEAQWEYAARGGVAGPDSPSGMWPCVQENLRRTRSSYGLRVDCGQSIAGEDPTRVRRPNPFGLRDLPGMILERCRDVFNETAYERHASRNPVTEGPGLMRSYRGACEYCSALPEQIMLRQSQENATSALWMSYRLVLEEDNGTPSARPWLIRPVLERSVADATVLPHPAREYGSPPVYQVPWPASRENSTLGQTLFVPDDSSELSFSLYMLDPALHWRLEKWLSAIDYQQEGSPGYANAAEISAQGPNGRKRYLLLFRFPSAVLVDLALDPWRLPSSFFQTYPPLQRLNADPRQKQRLVEKRLTPPGCATEVIALLEPGPTDNAPVLALIARQTGVKNPAQAIFQLPDGGPWTSYTLESVDFSGRKEAFTAIQFSGSGGAVLVHVNPWQGFALPPDKDLPSEEYWFAGRPLLVPFLEKRSFLPFAAYQASNQTSPPFGPNQRIAVVHPDLAEYFLNRHEVSDPAPPDRPYRIRTSGLFHWIATWQVRKCRPQAASHVLTVSTPPHGREPEKRAVWELALQCAWKQKRWLPAPDKPGPDEYALIEYEVPSYDRKTDQETTTTYIVGVNPWRAFIAEAVPQAGPPQAPARVEPPDFAPLATLPADLFPGKTLRLLEQAVWPR